jgi:hypothetical protein
MSRRPIRAGGLRGRTAAGLAGLVVAAGGAGLWVRAADSHNPATTQPTATTTPAVTLAAADLPNPALHPGAVGSLTRSDLCAAGFSTRPIRPPVSYTSRLKDLEFGTGGQITGPRGATYTVVGEHLPGTVADYELDHLISLEIGGNPEDPKNLWMEPWERRGPDHLAPAGRGAESKDLVENRLHREVCAGTLALADAQREIATDWTTAR